MGGTLTNRGDRSGEGFDGGRDITVTDRPDMR